MGIRYPEGRIGRPTGHERDTVQRMPGRRAPCGETAREPGGSPSTVDVGLSSHRFITAPEPGHDACGAACDRVE